MRERIGQGIEWQLADLEVVLLELANVLPPEAGVLVHRRPVEAPRQHLRLVLLKGAQHLQNGVPGLNEERVPLVWEGQEVKGLKAGA